MDFKQITDAICPLSANAYAKLLATVEEVSFSKGTLLFEDHRVENQLYFIKQGIARAFVPADQEDITFWFGMEGDPLLSMKSYTHAQRSYESIELLENCLLYAIPIVSLKALYNDSIELANWGRKLAEKELFKAEYRMIHREIKTASERYDYIIEHQPELLLRVPLGVLASYLGISQVSLSRIRAEIKKRTL